jgi:hypothetical protein
MGVKLIITERQLNVLQKSINENKFYESLVEKLVTDLNTNYEPMLGIMREDGEYFEEPMIKIKADETETTPRQVYQDILQILVQLDILEVLEQLELQDQQVR